MSGKGVHIFGLGQVPDGYMSKNVKLDIELYSKDRFICVTGDMISERNELTDCTMELTECTSNKRCKVFYCHQR